MLFFQMLFAIIDHEVNQQNELDYEEMTNQSNEATSNDASQYQGGNDGDNFIDPSLNPNGSRYGPGGGGGSNSSEMVSLTTATLSEVNSSDPVKIDFHDPTEDHSSSPVKLNATSLVQVQTAPLEQIYSKNVSEVKSSYEVQADTMNITSLPWLNLTQKNTSAPALKDAKHSKYHVGNTLQFNNTFVKWNTTVEVSNFTFLAIDGASDASIIQVKYTVYLPNGTVFFNKTTNASNPLHLIINQANLVNGNWTIELEKINVGNTSAWVQVVSPNHGTYSISGDDPYHKEIRHLKAGEARYFLINMNSSVDHWFSYNIARYSTSGNIFTELYPENFTWSRKEEGMRFRSIVTNLTNQTSLLVVANHEGLDAFIQIVHEQGAKAVNTTSLNTTYNETVEMKYSTETLVYNITGFNETDWFAIDACTQQSQVILYDLWSNNESGMERVGMYSSKNRSDVLHWFEDDVISQYFLWIYSNSSEVTTTHQFSWDGVEDQMDDLPFQRRVLFNVSGLAQYYSFNCSNTRYLGIDFTAQGSNPVVLQLWNESYVQIFNEESIGSDDMENHILVKNTNKNILCIYGVGAYSNTSKYSVVNVHLDGRGVENITDPNPRWINSTYSGA